MDHLREVLFRGCQTGGGDVTKSVALGVLSFSVVSMQVGCGAKERAESQLKQSMTIINGDMVLAGDPIAASTVALYYNDQRSDRTTPICTGTVIGRRTILSAAHCFVDVATSQKTTIEELATKLSVGFGVEIVASQRDPAVQFRAIESVDVHPNYKMNALAAAGAGEELDDVSIIHLSEDIPLSATVVSLSNDASVLEKGKVLDIAGYGVTKGGVNSVHATHLNRTQITIDEPNVNPTQFSYNVIGGHSACSGDSGGPAYTHDDNGKLVVVGVTSWGDGECKEVGVYTSVASLHDWIQSKTIH